MCALKLNVASVSQSVSMRLAVEMQQIALKQKLQSMESDMIAMSSWCLRFQEFGDRQGSLDVKYVSERYEKGCDAVKRFSETKHKIVEQENFSETQQHIVNFCHALGGRDPPLLGCALIDSGNSSAAPVVRSHAVPRLTLILLDLSSWPSSVSAELFHWNDSSTITKKSLVPCFASESNYVDDIVDCAKSIAAGSAKVAFLVLEPVVHAGVVQLAIVQKRRRVHDKIYVSFGSASME